MSDNPILTSCNEIINSFLPLVDHRLVGFISDDNAGFINARKCAVIHVDGILQVVFGNMEEVIYWNSIKSVILNIVITLWKIKTLNGTMPL